MVNNTEPRTVPCGTPTEILLELLSTPSIFVYCLTSVPNGFEFFVANLYQMSWNGRQRSKVPNERKST